MAGYALPSSMALELANQLDAKGIKGPKSTAVIYFGTIERTPNPSHHSRPLNR